jgi:hypothetical protein
MDVDVIIHFSQGIRTGFGSAGNLAAGRSRAWQTWKGRSEPVPWYLVRVLTGLYLWRFDVIDLICEHLKLEF